MKYSAESGFSWFRIVIGKDIILIKLSDISKTYVWKAGDKFFYVDPLNDLYEISAGDFIRTIKYKDSSSIFSKNRNNMFFAFCCTTFLCVAASLYVRRLIRKDCSIRMLGEE